MDKYQIIKKRFEALADPINATKMSAYMRNQFTFYGLSTPIRKAVYKELLRVEKKSRQIDWLFLNECWNDPHREFQYLVMDYLFFMQKFLTYEDVERIYFFICNKQWWETIDGLDRIVGNISFVDSRIDNLMLEWSTSDDLWVRRISIDHQLCRKEKTNTELLEEILVNNFGSNEFFINKAIGWSLRDYSKTNPHWVRKFLNKYGDRMSSLSIKEASKYLSKIGSD